jgi:hypothetical protein
MLFALGAASSVLDALQSLATTKSSSTQSAASGQTTNPFDLPDSSGSATAGASSGSGAPGWSRISPETMSALIAAQSQAGSTDTSSTSSTSPSDALNDLFSQIDADGDGQISKSEFENALGAGGTNVAQADDVFNKLDKDGDGSVSLDEMKSALQRAGGHDGGHRAGIGDASGGSADGSGSNSDPLTQTLGGSSSTSVTNSDGSTTTTITYPDGSKVTMTTLASSTSSSSNSSAAGSASSSYNWIEQMIQREAKAISANASNSLSVGA